MRKHVLGFTIFAFIVAAFVSVWTIFGYFTQTIPNVPTVQSEKLPVFKSDNRKSCRMKNEKLSYTVDNSYYFADTKTMSSTLVLKWNGFGVPPSKVFISQKIFTANNKEVYSGLEEAKVVSFDDLRRQIYVTVSQKIALDKSELEDNVYTDFTISDEAGIKYNSDFLKANQVVVVHGESSVVEKTDTIKP